MRISAIQNYGSYQPQKNLKLSKTNCNTGLLDGQAPNDTVSFKWKKTAKGGVVGAIVGLGGMALLSALSGGLATPLAYGLYAATFGTTGAQVGHILEKEDERKKAGDGDD